MHGLQRVHELRRLLLRGGLMTRPRLTGQTPNNDVYRVDAGQSSDIPRYVQVVGLWDGMPAELLAAARGRRAAALTGYCPFCRYAEQRHNTDCPSSQRRLSVMLFRWETYAKHAQRGKRLVEDPTSTIAARIYQTTEAQQGDHVYRTAAPAWPLRTSPATTQPEPATPRSTAAADGLRAILRTGR
jgi:hypothetical protein